ncbi:MAG: sulfurtransferase TusA family protein [Chloroflexi bacterium]|nr:sulfurtransferase TusA family protein [Chloroflexota bacterium]
MSLQTAVPHKTIDLTGLRCPNTLIATISALKTITRGEILQIIATDLNAPSNMTAWCRQSDHDLIDLYEENGRFIFHIQKN